MLEPESRVLVRRNAYKMSYNVYFATLYTALESLERDTSLQGSPGTFCNNHAIQVTLLFDPRNKFARS